MSRTINLGRVTGKSAYEIWLDLGNIGTEQDFINSLQGQQGIPGKDGANGTNGKDGKDGKDGTNGVDGQDGYTPIKGVDYFTEQDIASLNIPPKMAILKYGISTWADFMQAYTENAIVYCRASSASNPATGSQTRLAFMAYVNSEENPTNVEFQYYRSVTTHTDNQQGDQVYIYKLDKTAGWTVTVRNTFSKIEVGTGINKSYLNNAVILSLDDTLGNIEEVLTTLTTGGGVNGNS